MTSGGQQKVSSRKTEAKWGMMGSTSTRCKLSSPSWMDEHIPSSKSDVCCVLRLAED